MVYTRAEGRVTHTKLIPKHLAYGQRLVRFVQYVSLTHSAYVVCMKPMQAIHQHREIVRLIRSMSIQTHDDIPLCRFYASVHGVRHYLVWIVNQAYEGIFGGIASHNIPCLVFAHTIHQQDFQIIFGLRPSLLTLGRIDASIILLSLNRSLEIILLKQ